MRTAKLIVRASNANESRGPIRLVRDRLRFFNQPAGMWQNIYAGVESLWKTFFLAKLATKMLDGGQSRLKYFPRWRVNFWDWDVPESITR